MNINEFAKILDGREVGKEMGPVDEMMAKDFGYVVVFGYSDDNTEFRGAINDEIGCYNSRDILLDKQGLIEKCDCECKYYKAAIKEAKVIKAIWNGNGYPCWTYETEIPHAIFDVIDDGEKYCRGIVFYFEDLEG